ncbi:hypothetical protein LHT11_01635 [Acetobacter indonesiensis]|uniref:hypothetical protein n=1 Tax=Acetobacter indonesiensis TaxID=104101 RepID=UPI001F20E32C|nr:hypothetical protein [Acetobacter indonesiensis]MCG0993902.1 hypothetical protein [Acetobacter indonesiensis]
MKQVQALGHSLALDMLLSLHCLCIREGPAIPEPWAAFGPQQAGDGDAVNRGGMGRSFHV